MQTKQSSKQKSKTADAKKNQKKAFSQSAKKQPPQPEQIEGEQGKLLDVGPKHSDKILKHAKRYRAAMLKRKQFGEEEVQLKRELLAMIHEEHLQRTEDGKIEFTIDEFKITVTPVDEKISVRPAKADD